MQYISANDNYCSSMIPVNCGVPQGSIVDPYLFLVYTKELATCFHTKMALYADDAVIIWREESKQALQVKSEAELKNVKS